jgi:hypothetical protein
MWLAPVRAPDRAILSRSTNHARTRPGVGSGWPPALPNSASICWSWARRPGPVSAIGTLTKTSSSISSGGPGVLVTDAGETMLNTGDCAGFKAGERDGHHLQNRGEATALILEVGTRGPAEPHAEYPDIDLRVTAQGYVRKDGTPYS